MSSSCWSITYNVKDMKWNMFGRIRKYVTRKVPEDKCRWHDMRKDPKNF